MGQIASQVLCFGVLFITLIGCHPSVAWHRLDTTQAQFNMDDAQCELMAESPERVAFDAPRPRERRDAPEILVINNAPGNAAAAAHNAALTIGEETRRTGEAVEGGLDSLGAAIGAAMQKRRVYKLCMQAKGYVEGAAHDQ